MPDRYNSAVAKLIGRLNRAKGNYAVTISKNTTLYSCSQADVSERFRRHEECHKKQYRRYRFWLAFIVIYLFMNIKNGYCNNPFEIEARAAENE